MSKTAATERYGDLTRGPVRKHLLRLSLPMTYGIAAMISFYIADMYFISLLGTKELTALTFCFPVTMIIFHLIIGLGIGMSSVLSRLIGGGQYQLAARIATHGIMFAFLVGIFISTLGLAFQVPIFRTMGATEDILPLILNYMTVWFAGCLFITVPVIGNAAIRAGGNARFPGRLMISVAVFNLLLDPVLIFGLFGFPRMEMQGAALATVLGEGIAMTGCLSYLLLRTKLLTRANLRLPVVRDCFFNSVSRLLHVGLPAGLTAMLTPLLSGAVVWLLASQGHEAVAAYGVAARIESFALIPVMGLAVGMAPIIGQNRGAGFFKRTGFALRLALGSMAAWSVFIALFLAVFGQPLARLFTGDPEIIRLAVLYFWIVPFSYVLGNLSQGWASAFNALGHPLTASALVTLRIVFVTIPFAALGIILTENASGLFVALALANILTGAAIHLYGRARFRKERDGPRKD